MHCFLQGRRRCRRGPAAVTASYPERAVTIVVPFAPGGANDVVVRIIQQPLSAALGQPVIVENRGGAGGNIGFGHVARARPDGYTLLLAPSSFAVNVSLYEKVPYDPFKDFEPVARAEPFPRWCSRCGKRLGVSTLAAADCARQGDTREAELLDPGARHGSASRNRAAQAARVQSTSCTSRIAARRRPRRRCSAGTVDIATTSIAVAKPLIDAGAIKALAVTGAERWPDLPDVPTVEEAGTPRNPSRKPGRACWCRPARRARSSRASPRR